MYNYTTVHVYYEKPFNDFLDSIIFKYQFSVIDTSLAVYIYLASIELSEMHDCKQQ